MALEPYILPQDQLRMDRPQVPAGIVNALLAETSKDMAHSLVLDGYDMQVTLDGNPPTSADIVWRDPKAAAINAGHSTDYARDMHHQFGDLYWCDLEPEVWWYVAGKIGNTATVKITVRDTDCWEFHPVQKEPT